MELEKELSIDQNLSNVIINNAFDAIVYYTPQRNSKGVITDFTFTYMNESSFRVLRGSRDDYMGKSFLTLFPYGAVNGMFDDFVKTAETNIPSENTYYYEHGEYKGWYRDSIVKSGDGIIVYFRDVTESKNLEISLSLKKNELQDSLNLISNIIESIRDPFLVIDTEFRVIYANAAMQFWFKSTPPFRGKLLWDLLPLTKSTRIERLLNEYMKRHTYVSFNSRGFAPDRYYYISVYPYYGGLSIYAQDITDKRRSEEQLKSSLKEKEILLKEIHHRVKNNLQLIASMINLQCSFAKDSVYNDLLNDTKNRISTMALIHKRLYEETNYASINFRGYAEELVNSLFGMYKTEGKKIQLKYSIDDIDTGLDYSINIGLILNELMTNSMKYAFTGMTEGELYVEIKKSCSDIVICVKDNGVGFPDNLDHMNTGSLGLLIVNSLVEQLNGKIELKRNGGTAFIITLKKEKKNQLTLL